jgi:zinc finger SWIM domain-containing protein 3
MKEHDMVVNETFSSEEGYKYYNAYAKSKGFGVRKEELTKKPGTNIAFRRLYVCSKEGYRARKHFEKTKRKRTPRPLSRCGCGARMEIEMSMESGEWFVKDFVVEHNHPLAIGDQTTFIRSHRGLNDAQKADAIEYGIGGLRTHEIMEVMEKQHGGPEKVGFVPRDLYNFFAKYKKEGLKVVMLNLCSIIWLQDKRKIQNSFTSTALIVKGTWKTYFGQTHSVGWITMPLVVSWSLIAHTV